MYYLVKHQETGSAWRQNYASDELTDKVLEVLRDPAQRGHVIQMSTKEARKKYPNLVVALVEQSEHGTQASPLAAFALTCHRVCEGEDQSSSLRWTHPFFVKLSGFTSLLRVRSGLCRWIPVVDLVRIGATSEDNSASEYEGYGLTTDLRYSSPRTSIFSGLASGCQRGGREEEGAQLVCRHRFEVDRAPAYVVSCPALLMRYALILCTYQGGRRDVRLR